MRGLYLVDGASTRYRRSASRGWYRKSDMGGLHLACGIRKTDMEGLLSGWSWRSNMKMVSGGLCRKTDTG